MSRFLEALVLAWCVGPVTAWASGVAGVLGRRADGVVAIGAHGLGQDE